MALWKKLWAMTPWARKKREAEERRKKEMDDLVEAQKIMEQSMSPISRQQLASARRFQADSMRNAYGTPGYNRWAASNLQNAQQAPAPAPASDNFMTNVLLYSAISSSHHSDPPASAPCAAPAFSSGGGGDYGGGGSSGSWDSGSSSSYSSSSSDSSSSYSSSSDSSSSSSSDSGSSSSSSD